MNHDVVGGSPLIKIKYIYQGKIRFVYAKLEYFNITGSIKDRIASFILNEAKRKGILHDEQAIVEATSGNTGISFAALGKKYHHPVHIFLPDWVSEERKKIMELYGAEVHLVLKEEGGFKEAIKRADDLAFQIRGFRPDQFNNMDNVIAHYNGTGLEIIKKLNLVSGFVSGIGTGGTIMGVGKRIKEQNENAKIIALEPDKLPIMTKKITSGSHKIEGIGDDFIPSIVNLNMIDEIVTVDDMDSINMSRKLSNDLGLGVGISSGANFLVAATHKTYDLVTVFSDDSKKYLSTDLTKPLDYNPNFLSNQIELVDYTLVD